MTGPSGVDQPAAPAETFSDVGRAMLAVARGDPDTAARVIVWMSEDDLIRLSACVGTLLGMVEQEAQERDLSRSARSDRGEAS